MEGVQEKEIGAVNKTPNSRCYVSLVRMPYGDTYIVVSNQFRAKNSKGWYNKRQTWIPFHSAGQISALISAAVQEGWKLNWN